MSVKYWVVKARATTIAMFVLVAGGCAAPARVDQMSIKADQASTLATSAPESLRKAVAVRDVTGGKDTNPMWVSQVGTSEFEGALQESLKAVGLFNENRAGAAYAVIADLAKLDQPFIGLDLTVTASVNYKVVDQ